jgi:hypothetical protein
VQCLDQRGHRYTKSVEVAPQGNYLAKHLEDVLIGNSVCPDEAEALVAANAADIIELYQRLAA